MNEQIERVGQDVDNAVHFFWMAEDCVGLMGRLVQLKKSRRFPQEEWSALRAAEDELGNHLVKELREIAEHAIRERDPRYKIPALCRFRDLLKNEGLPSRVRKALEQKLAQIYAVLNKNSKEAAELLVYRINEILEAAEANVQNENLSIALRLNSASSAPARVCKLLSDIKPHVQYVGLPAVARKKKTTVEAILEGFQSRAEALRALIPGLERAVVYEKENAAAIAEMRARLVQEVRKQQEREEREAARQQALAGLQRRCPAANATVSQFYESLKTGNLGEAWACLGRIRGQDGGIPKIMQEDYSRAAQKQPLRAVCA